MGEREKKNRNLPLLHVVLAAYLPLCMYVLHTTVPPCRWEMVPENPFAVGMSAVRRHGIFVFVRCGRFSSPFDFLCGLEKMSLVHLLFDVCYGR